MPVSIISRLLRAIGLPAIAALAIVAAPAQAGYLGHSVDADYRFPNIGTVFDGMSTQVVGAGTEFSLFGVDIDLDDDTIHFSRPGPVSFSPGSFNGWSFFDVFATIDPVIGVEVISSTVGLDNSRLSFDADTVWVNFVNLASATNFDAVVRVRFSTAAVPAPATVALAAFALGIAVLARRRRA